MVLMCTDDDQCIFSRLAKFSGREQSFFYFRGRSPRYHLRVADSFYKAVQKTYLLVFKCDWHQGMAELKALL